MSENNKTSQPASRGTFVERLVRKALSSFGGVFERPFQNENEENRLPSTSDLTERLKRLIDSGVREQEDGSRLAPHLIRLKFSWGQTSEEFDSALDRLKTELLIVAIDHINDNRYRTIKPVKMEAKPDVLTEGFSLAVGFDESDVVNAEKVEVPAEIFADLVPQENKKTPEKPNYADVKAKFTLSTGIEREIILRFVPDGKTNLTVGRSKENDLFLDDKSVSKLHASLVLDSEGKLRVADIGSTNGTIIRDDRVSYGKAYEINSGDKVKFGEIEVKFDWDLDQFNQKHISEPEQVNEINVETVDGAHPNKVISSTEREDSPTEEAETVRRDINVSRIKPEQSVNETNVTTD